MNTQSKIWIVASLIAVFVIGMAAGFFSERLLVHRRYEKRYGLRERGRHFPTLVLMSKDLDLTPSQQEAVRAIFQKNEERLKIFDGEIHQKIGKIRSLLKSEIAGLLTPEQKKKFESMIERCKPKRERPCRQKAGDSPLLLKPGESE